MQARGHDIAVCSWSLAPRSIDELLSRVSRLGLSHVHLGLGALLGPDPMISLSDVRQCPLKPTAGMIDFVGEDYTTISSIRRTGGFIADETWPQRRQRALDAAQVAVGLGITQISMHAGFLPASDDPRYQIITQRVCEVAEAYRSLNLMLLMETGQESASHLLQFLNDLNCRNVGVNFDPANMVLYGSGDPIEAIGILSRHIRHVHVKDAVYSEAPRIHWGKEVAFGSGVVAPQRFLDALRAVAYTGPLSIEREQGDNVFGDIQTAIAVLRELQ